MECVKRKGSVGGKCVMGCLEVCCVGGFGRVCWRVRCGGSVDGVANGVCSKMF